MKLSRKQQEAIMIFFNKAKTYYQAKKKIQQRLREYYENPLEEEKISKKVIMLTREIKN